MGSLSANLQRYGFERVAKIETLQEIIAGMNDDAETGDRPENPAHSVEDT